MFDKTGRNTDGSKVQRYSDGLQIIDGGRIEVEGIQFFDDFFNLANDSTNKYTTSEEGTSNALDPVDAINGVLQIDSGTAADKVNSIASMLNFSAARGVTAEFRIKTLTSDADLMLFCGLTDAQTESTGELPIDETATLVEGTADGIADDFAGFALHTEINDKLYAMSCLAAAAPQSDDTGHEIVLLTWLKLRIELDTTGNAKFYVDDVLVATHALAITAADPLCLYFGTKITDGSTAAFAQMDYWAAHQARVV